MIASLGMYDFGDAIAANDRLWAATRDLLRTSGIDAPEALTRGDTAYWQAWQSPELLLSQTCGFPFRAKLHSQVTLVGTPDYGIPGCPPGYYCSVLIARAADPRTDIAAFDGAELAYNEAMSQSGWAAPQNHAAEHGLHFKPALCSGAHRRSAVAVAESQADLAAVDAVTWRLLQRNDPKLAADLKVVGQTSPTPGLPYITAKSRAAAPILAALQEAIAGLDSQSRATLGLCGIAKIPASAYLAVPTPSAPDQIAQLI